jgi:DNA-binding LacI/PurR family transcriptional regulator
MNDMMSFGLAKALNERGLKIGKDLSLVSYDNLDLIQALGIELSSVDQDVNHLGRLSSELLLDMMKEKCDRKTIVLQPKLIKRDSVKKF